MFRPSLTSPPFTRNAFAVSRWPFTETLPADKMPETGRSCWIDPEVAGATPACSPSRSMKLRPFSGSESICFVPTT